MAEITENKKLQNTIVINGKPYDITAKESEIATKVQNALDIICSYGTDDFETKTESTSFNGENHASIQYVSADKGGKFNKPVYVDNSDLFKNNMQGIPDEAVVNHIQFLNELYDLKGTALYTWNAADTHLHTLVNEKKDQQIYSLAAIVGDALDFDVFKRLIGTPYSGATTKAGAYNGIKFEEIPTEDQDIKQCKVIGYETAYSNGISNVIIPYKAYIHYTDNSEDYTKLDRSIGNQVINVGDNAFKDNDYIESVLLPESITSIGAEAFSGCTKLKSITIPKSVTTIGASAFNGCINLETVIYAGTSTDWNNIQIADGNGIISDKVSYQAENLETTPNGIITFEEILEKPFIYICRDKEGSDIDSDTTLFLKLPEEFNIIRISNSAIRLNSTRDQSLYYTYGGILEILAKINQRLEALGANDDLSKSLKILKTKEALPDITEVVDKVEDDFVPEAIPNIHAIAEAIEKINKELYTLNEEVSYIEDPETYKDAIDSRIDVLEDWHIANKTKLNLLLKAFVSDEEIEYPDEIEFELTGEN